MEKDFQELLILNFRLLRTVSATYARLNHFEETYKDSIRKQEQKWGEASRQVGLTYLAFSAFILALSERPDAEKIIYLGLIGFGIAGYIISKSVGAYLTKEKRQLEEHFATLRENVNRFHTLQQTLASLLDLLELFESKDHFNMKEWCIQSIERNEERYSSRLERAKGLQKQIQQTKNYQKHLDYYEFQRTAQQLQGFEAWWHEYKKKS